MNLAPLVPLAAVALVLVGCTNANESAKPDAGATRATACKYPAAGQPAKPVDPPSETDVINTGEAKAMIHMTAGDIEVTLDRGSAPCTVNSFLSLAQQGWLDNTTCHRLVDQGIFVLQCGDPSGTGSGGPGYTILDELSPATTSLEKVSTKAVNYPPGTLAMANTGAPNTGGSQWFIVWDNTPLPPSYAVFGKIDDAGLKIVRDIAAQGVSAEDGIAPIAEAKITSVTLG